MKEILNAQEMCVALGIKRTTLWRLEKLGRVKAIAGLRHKRYHHSEVAKLAGVKVSDESARRFTDVKYDAPPAGPITSRDQFAIAAMQGLIACPTCDLSIYQVVSTAYSYADAMLAERAKGNAT